MPDDSIIPKSQGNTVSQSAPTQINTINQRHPPGTSPAGCKGRPGATCAVPAGRDGQVSRANAKHRRCHAYPTDSVRHTNHSKLVPCLAAHLPHGANCTLPPTIRPRLPHTTHTPSPPHVDSQGFEQEPCRTCRTHTAHHLAPQHSCSICTIARILQDMFCSGACSTHAIRATKGVPQSPCAHTIHIRTLVTHKLMTLTQPTNNTMPHIMFTSMHGTSTMGFLQPYAHHHHRSSTSCQRRQAFTACCGVPTRPQLHVTAPTVSDQLSSIHTLTKKHVHMSHTCQGKVLWYMSP